MKAKARTVVIHPRTVYRAVFLAFLTIALTLMLTGAAFATATPMGNVLCTVVEFIIHGNLGRGLATLGIIMVGIGAMIGKVSWGLALTVGVGISVIFGAYDIAALLGVSPSC
jgi:type IV secretory pathway VirB2 component (pilin)